MLKGNRLKSQRVEFTLGSKRAFEACVGVKIDVAYRSASGRTSLLARSLRFPSPLYFPCDRRACSRSYFFVLNSSVRGLLSLSDSNIGYALTAKST